jgi:hypothetical protein
MAGRMTAVLPSQTPRAGINFETRSVKLIVRYGRDDWWLLIYDYVK